jgi:predicted DCC family thiol-disulfide oxidoreductase YuxK
LIDPTLDKIVLFDGVCNFCNNSVQFILKHDSSGSLKFASLQSPTGQALLKQYSIPTTVDSVIFIENGMAYTRSDAALKIVRYFGGLWSVFLVFNLVPSPIRNFFYDSFARNRYKWFGKRESCMLPSREVRTRFVDI